MVAVAARVSKYGISLEQALWDVPLAVINQLIIFDDLSNGRQPRWRMDQDDAQRSIEECMLAELTPSPEHADDQGDQGQGL